MCARPSADRAPRPGCGVLGRSRRDDHAARDPRRSCARLSAIGPHGGEVEMLWVSWRQHRTEVIGVLAAPSFLHRYRFRRGVRANAPDSSSGSTHASRSRAGTRNCVDLAQEWRNRVGLLLYLFQGFYVVPALVASYVEDHSSRASSSRVPTGSPGRRASAESVGPRRRSESCSHSRSRAGVVLAALADRRAASSEPRSSVALSLVPGIRSTSKARRSFRS